MQYLNLDLVLMETERFLDSPREHIATWLLLLRHCAAHENGGRIAGAGAWNEHKCQRLLRCSLDELRETSLLWRWDDQALVVVDYPTYQEQRMKQKRKAGAKGGRQSAESRPARNSPVPPSVDGGGTLPARGHRHAPSVDEVLQYAASLKGSMGELTGCPTIDAEWARQWWEWRDNEENGAWARVRSWQRLLTNDWRRQWRSWQRRQAKARGEGGTASAFGSETPARGQAVKVL